jgi:hypothetical protein
MCERSSHADCSGGEHLAIQELPWYAERSEDAATAVQVLRERHGIDLRLQGVASFLPERWKWPFIDPETEPLAICIAALVALGEDV